MSDCIACREIQETDPYKICESCGDRRDYYDEYAE